MKNRSIRKVLAGLLTIVTVAAFTACGNKESGNGGQCDNCCENNASAGASSGAAAAGTAGTASGSEDPVELVNVDFAVSSSGYGGLLPVIAAFGNTDEAVGLNSVLQNVGTASETLAAIESGKVNVGGFSAPAPLLSIASGESNLIIIGGQMSDYESLIVLPENKDAWSGKLTADLLAGKTIAVNRTNSGDIALRAYLAESGIDLSTINYVELDSGASVVEAVKKGEADAGIVNGGFYKSAEESGLVNVQFIREIIGDDFICCRQMVSREGFDENRELYVKVEKALILAYEIYRSNPDLAVELGAQYITSSPEDIRYIVYEYGDLGLSPDPNIAGIKSYYEGMKLSGYIDAATAQSLEGHLDASIYKQALDELLAEQPENEYLLELLEAYNANDL